MIGKSLLSSSASVLLVFGLTLLGQSPKLPNNSNVDIILEQVAAIHGAAGVFAVAGYRMGQQALHDLSEPRGSFALDVTHRTPLKVQYSCVADGWQAATGVSAGKSNLHIVEAKPEDTETVFQDSNTHGACI